MVDWNLAGNANPFADFAQGFQQGRDNMRQRERDKAYQSNVQAQQQRAERLDMEDQRRAQAEQEAARLAQLKTVFEGIAKTVPEGQRLAAFQKAAPMLMRFGLPQEEIATTTEDELSNATLAMIGAQIDSAVEEYTLAPGAKRFRGNQVIADNPAQERPIPVPQGTTLVDPNTLQPRYTAPKTYAPPRAGGGGPAGLPPPPAGWQRRPGQ